MRRTLVIVKPDAVNRSLVGEVINRFERKGLKIVGMKMERLNVYKLKDHYSHHQEKPFYNELLDFMMSIPCVLMVIEGKEAVRVVRKIVGETNGREATPGTIRGDFSMSTQTNLVHASENDEVAKYEIDRFFNPNELWEYDKINFNWIYCNSEKSKFSVIEDHGRSVEEIEHAKKKMKEMEQTASNK